MRDLLNIFTLQDGITFNGTLSELDERLKLGENKYFRTEWINENELKFVANRSAGIFMSIGRPITEGIKGYATITSKNEKEQHLALKTKFRWELIIVLVPLIFLIPVIIVGNTNIKSWVLIVFPLITLYFGFVFRLQEKSLFEVFKKSLVK